MEKRLGDLLRRRAGETPDAVGLTVDETVHWRFSQLLERAQDQAGWMREHGVVGGDRVMLVAENGVDFVTACFAVWLLDAWAMPVNARLSAGEITRLRDHAGPKMMLFTSAVSSDAKAHGNRHGAVEAPGFDGMLFCCDRNAKPEPVIESADQIAALIYTTGTTGDPKGVMLSHGNLLWYASVARNFRKLTGDDHVYCALPLTHIFGLGNAMLGALETGARLEIATRFSADRMLDAIRRGVSVLPAVPAMYAQLLDLAAAEGIERLDAPKLRNLLTGGAPLDRDWKIRVERFFNRRLHNGYGMTECSPGIASTPLSPFEPDPDDLSCGPPLPGLSVRLDAAGDDGVGEILVSGPNVMHGYYRNASASAAAFAPDGAFRTGDLGRFDDAGNLHLVGRSKELIIRSGFNVYPPEVESALSLHPAVTLAAVVGRGDGRGNEEVIAFIQPVPGTSVSEAELSSFIRDELAPYKRPSHFVFADALPAASSGKILKHLLLPTFADRLPPVMAE